MPGGARLKSVWVVGRAVAAGLLLLVSAPPLVSASAAESRGAATQDGWWNRLQGPVEGEPEGNPVRPFVPALPKPPNVPADAIAVGVTAGQVDKVAAVGIDVSLTDGATLAGLVLRLKESAENGANVDAAKAKVVACPATVAWGPGQSANWADRPGADCSLGSAEGVRGDDGTWTFDLAAIGRQWTDPFAPLPAYGVVLSVDPATSPPAVQVSWLNFDSGNVAVELAASPPAGGIGETSPPAAPTPGETPPPTPDPPAAYADAAATTVFPPSGGAAGDPLAYSSGQAGFSPVSPPGTDVAQPDTVPGAPVEATLSAAPGPPGPVLQARPAVGFWERVPAPTALLVPVAAALALVVAVALGPLGRPSPVFRREGGLSRALARRRDAGLRPPAATP